jgi:DNA/RNA endonuclease YhcR with UshA esterase domain
MAIRTIKIAAVGVAVVGLLFLWFLAIRAESPLVPIGQVGAAMNLAYVRLEGRVIRGPSFDPDSHALAFWLADDTGEIYVAAYRHEAEELMVLERVPALGDRVSLVGTLRIREDFVSLTINAADQVTVTKPEPSDRSVAEIDLYSELERVRLRGQVRDIRSPYEGLTLIGLRDATGAIEVAVPEETLALTGDLVTPLPGQTVEVEGTVTFYKETPQLTLTNVADLTPLAEAADVAPIRLISEIGADAVGDWVGMQGFVTRVAPFSAGVKLTLDDGSGEVAVLLWQDLYDELAPTAVLEEGTALTVYGQVAEYRGQLELIPELPIDLQLVAIPGLPEPRAIGSLSGEDVGRHAQLAGTLGEPGPFSAGVKFTLDDGTGCIILLLWQRTYEEIAATQALKAGTEVTVIGEVAEYRDTLEIIPRRAADVTVTGYTPLPTPEPLLLAQLTGSDVDQTVTVIGVLGDAQPFSAGVKFTLDDGSGEIVLLLWQDVYDALNGRLAAGARVQVRGQIAEYRGDLEIIPRTAADVTVLDKPTPTPVATSTELPTATLTPTPTFQVVCTPPPCKEGEVYYCPGECPGGCGTQCATPTPVATPTASPVPTDTATPVPTPTVGATALGEIDAGRAGETLTVRGQVVSTASFSAGFKFTLDDSTGQILLLLWGEVYDGVVDVVGLNVDATALVTGEIGEYEGELQIVPAEAGRMPRAARSAV